jgi:acetoin utilization deacetylase AcuC-like enzyme
MLTLSAMRHADLATLGWPSPVVIVTHPDMLGHRPLSHDDDAERLAAAWEGIDAAARDGIPLIRRESQCADPEHLARAHEAGYLAHLQEACARGDAWFGSRDCPLTEGTWRSSLLAAGAGIVAWNELAEQDRSHRAFCAIRPPGHHAHAARAGGFCYLNNAMITARAILHRDEHARVLIVDLDFHHGDGTEAMLRDDARCAYVSVHGDPSRHFPGTGHGMDHERIIDIPVRDGVGDNAWLAALESGLERLSSFAPTAVLVSFGTDALAGDPVGDLGLTAKGLARGVAAVITRWPAVPLISFLEGGYDLQGLREGVRQHIHALAGAL